MRPEGEPERRADVDPLNHWAWHLRLEPEAGARGSCELCGQKGMAWRTQTADEMDFGVTILCETCAGMVEGG